MSQLSTPRPIFLKLGGSLITDKRQTEAIREDVLQRLAAEIAAVWRARPVPLVIGHGSGSFGHIHAKEHGTRDGVQTAAQWLGFARTGDAAARLNRAVVAALLEAGLPAWTIQPGALLRGRDGVVVQGMVDTIAGALQRGLVPVLHGDVILDDLRGGTIASTEEIFEWFLPTLRPTRIVLAGEVDGIFTKDPLRHPDATRLPTITPSTLATLAADLGGSHGVDVTGGMIAKVKQAVRMVQALSDVSVIICSGLETGHLVHVLEDADTARMIGTRIVMDGI